MQARLLPAWLFVLSISLTAIAAGTVFVEEPTGPLPHGISPQAVRELVVSAAKGLGQEIAENKGEAEFILRPKLVLFGAAYLFSVEKWSKGKLVNSTELKGRELEELDTLSKRVVRAVCSTTEATQSARVNEVSADESLAERRKLNRSGSTFAVGPSLSNGLNSNSIGFLLSYGSGWAIGPFTLGYAFDFDLNPDILHNALFLDGNINLTYFFLDRDFSPFITGQFGLGAVRESTNGNIYGGLLVGAIAGIALFRTYGIHLQLGIQTSVLLESAYPSVPLLVALRIGASF